MTKFKTGDTVTSVMMSAEAQARQRYTVTGQSRMFLRVRDEHGIDYEERKRIFKVVTS